MLAPAGRRVSCSGRQYTRLLSKCKAIICARQYKQWQYCCLWSSGQSSQYIRLSPPLATLSGWKREREPLSCPQPQVVRHNCLLWSSCAEQLFSCIALSCSIVVQLRKLSKNYPRAQQSQQSQRTWWTRCRAEQRSRKPEARWTLSSLEALIIQHVCMCFYFYLYLGVITQHTSKHQPLYACLPPPVVINRASECKIVE